MHLGREYIFKAIPGASEYAEAGREDRVSKTLVSLPPINKEAMKEKRGFVMGTRL